MASAPDAPSAPTTLLATAGCPPRTSASLCVSQSFAHNLGPPGAPLGGSYILLQTAHSPPIHIIIVVSDVRATSAYLDILGC